MPTDHTPQPKVAQIGIAGAMTTAVFWLLDKLCVAVTPIGSSIITTLISSLSGYLTQDPQRHFLPNQISRKVWVGAVGGLLPAVSLWLFPCPGDKPPTDQEVSAVTAVIMFFAGYLVPEKETDTDVSGAQQGVASGTK